MNAKVRATIYAVAAAAGTVALIYGWATSDQVEAWLRLGDSLLNLIAVLVPLLALRHLTPDPKPTVEGEVVVDEKEPSGD